MLFHQQIANATGHSLLNSLSLGSHLVLVAIPLSI